MENEPLQGQVQQSGDARRLRLRPRRRQGASWKVPPKLAGWKPPELAGRRPALRSAAVPATSSWGFPAPRSLAPPATHGGTIKMRPQATNTHLTLSLDGC